MRVGVEGVPFVQNGIDGNVTGVNGMLGAPETDGLGRVHRVPMLGSPLIYAVALSTHVDHLGAPLKTDQRGEPRDYAATTDVGVVER